MYLIQWPDGDDGNVEEYFTESEAIGYTMASALSRGICYMFEEDALQDFITVHWAMKINLT